MTDKDKIYRSLLKEYSKMHNRSFQTVYMRRHPEHYRVWLFEMGLLETRNMTESPSIKEYNEWIHI